MSTGVGNLRAREAGPENGLVHFHRCPTCPAHAAIRRCEMMADRFDYEKPCWACISSGRSTWPTPVKAAASAPGVEG